MTSPSPVVLMLITTPELQSSAERAAAAVGVRVACISPESAELTHRTWLAAAAVVIDEEAARRCGHRGLPRRAWVVLLTLGEPGTAAWECAINIGAQRLCALPAGEDQLVGQLSEATEAVRDGLRPGRVIAITAGRGGAGSSIFSVALALSAGQALLLDVDPFSGGIDLLLGGEAVPGLRWPDLSLRGGRLNWAAVRDALPEHRGVSVLSSTRRGHEMNAGQLGAVIDAGQRGGTTVVCDVPRWMTDATAAALDRADLVVTITTCDVRAVAATSALAPALRIVNPNIGLVVRGPSPGGLRAGDIADTIGLPLLAAMRPEHQLTQSLEQGGLRLRRRSPLAVAARQVLALLDNKAQKVAA